MGCEPEIYHRHSIRLRGYDYAGEGLYFVTICAHREFVRFGKGNPFCGDRATCESPVREIIAEEWQRCGEVRDDVFPEEFVVMPDHFHGLIRIKNGRSSLGHVIGAFKASVSRRIHRGGAGMRACRGDTHVALPRDMRIWHRNYYEMIVCNDGAREKIAEYIRMNPWKNVVHFSGGMRGIGNPGLMNMDAIGMLCSRRCPEDMLGAARQRALNAQGNHCVMSGFHSPPEKTLLSALLQCDAKIICCPAWGIDTMKIPADWLPSLKKNRMLILEMQNLSGNLAAAKERNIFVIQSAAKLWVPYASPNGMVERLVSELKSRNKII